MESRLGQVLVKRGVLTGDQVDHVLRLQNETGEPFGLIAERTFGISPAIIEDAWAEQYAQLTTTVDPRQELVETDASALITRRQAWQFRILPLRFEGRELVIVTTRQHLRRALRFATNVIGIPVFFVLAEPAALGEALIRHHPLPGLTAVDVFDDAMDDLLERCVGKS